MLLDPRPPFSLTNVTRMNTSAPQPVCGNFAAPCRELVGPSMRPAGGRGSPHSRQATPAKALCRLWRASQKVKYGKQFGVLDAGVIAVQRLSCVR
jgi:hypothetical protein